MKPPSPPVLSSYADATTPGSVLPGETHQDAPGASQQPRPPHHPAPSSYAAPAAEPEALPWIVEGVLPPGQVHLIGGAPRAGKTAFECWMASHILRELPFLGHRTHRPPAWAAVILDRAPEDRLFWWNRAGIEPLPHYCLAEDGTVDLERLGRLSRRGFFDLLVQILDNFSLPRGSVVTIDVANALVADSRSTYLSGFTSGLQLSKLAHARGLTILALMHGSKQVGDTSSRYVRPTDRIIAGTGFLGAVGTVAYLASAKESGCHATPAWQDFGWEPHHHAAQDFRLERTGNGLFCLQDSAERDIERKVKPAERLRPEDLLPYVPYAPNYIEAAHLVDRVRELHDVSRATIYRWLKELQDQKLVALWKDAKERPVQGKWCRPPAEA